MTLDLSPLVLAAVRCAETEGRPLTAQQLAHFLDIPQLLVDFSLEILIAEDAIWKVGDRFRFDLTRPLTAFEDAKASDLLRRFREIMRHDVSTTPSIN